MKHNQIEDLIYIFSKLPGLGARSARRIVLHLLKDKEIRMPSLIQTLNDAYKSSKLCNICNNLDTQEICQICTNPYRDDSQIIVVETVADLWAMERSNSFKGKYHVLGASLSASKGSMPETMGLNKLRNRIIENEVREIIIANSSTLDGQTTAFFIADYLSDLNLKLSRLASGIPIGGELEYLDDGTLSAALKLRQDF
jgi:recombination protein RecR